MTSTAVVQPPGRHTFSEEEFLAAGILKGTVRIHVNVKNRGMARWFTAKLGERERTYVRSEEGHQFSVRASNHSQHELSMTVALDGMVAASVMVHPMTYSFIDRATTAGGKARALEWGRAEVTDLPAEEEPNLIEQLQSAGMIDVCVRHAKKRLPSDPVVQPWTFSSKRMKLPDDEEKRAIARSVHTTQLGEELACPRPSAYTTDMERPSIGMLRLYCAPRFPVGWTVTPAPLNSRSFEIPQ